MLGGARDALDLPGGQPEHLAELADRAARAEGREGGDQRGAFVAVALVDARDQDLADLAREVEVDVGQVLRPVCRKRPSNRRFWIGSMCERPVR